MESDALQNLWSKISAFFMMYVMGSFYAFKQLSWRVNRTVKRPSDLTLGSSAQSTEYPLALITGGSKGIGLELAKLLVAEKFSVILVARNKQDGQKAVKTLESLAAAKQYRPIVRFCSVDLSDIDQLKQFVTKFKQEFKKLHLLVNNAGLMMMPFTPIKNKPYEIQWATNVVATIYLTETLAPLLKRAATEDHLGRVVNLSSSAMFAHNLKKSYFRTPITAERYSSHAAYGNSKVAISLYTRHVQKKFDGSDVVVSSLHPGIISTDLYQHLTAPNRLFFGNFIVRSFLRSAESAAWDMLYLCLSPKETLTPGGYYENTVPCKMSYVDPDTSRAFEEYVEQIVSQL